MAPISGLLNSFWEEVDIRSNQVQLNSAHQNGPIIWSILNKLSLSSNSRLTYASTEGNIVNFPLSSHYMIFI